jgi:hypothetical protein
MLPFSSEHLSVEIERHVVVKVEESLSIAHYILELLFEALDLVVFVGSVETTQENYY